MKESLMAVSHTLKELFNGKSELVGFDDWDKFVGCIITIERIANGISNDKEVNNDG